MGAKDSRSFGLFDVLMGILVRFINSTLFGSISNDLLHTVDGDCGSWVVNSETGDLYGLVVSGYPNTGIAYIIPARDVFDEMQRKLRAWVKLPTSEDMLKLQEEEHLLFRNRQLILEKIALGTTATKNDTSTTVILPPAGPPPLPPNWDLISQTVSPPRYHFKIIHNTLSSPLSSILDIRDVPFSAEVVDLECVFLDLGGYKSLNHESDTTTGRSFSAEFVDVGSATRALHQLSGKPISGFGEAARADNIQRVKNASKRFFGPDQMGIDNPQGTPFTVEKGLSSDKHAKVATNEDNGIPTKTAAVNELLSGSKRTPDTVKALWVGTAHKTHRNTGKNAANELPFKENVQAFNTNQIQPHLNIVSVVQRPQKKKFVPKKRSDHIKDMKIPLFKGKVSASGTEASERQPARAFQGYASSSTRISKQKRKNNPVKLDDLREFSESFKLDTPVPGDPVPILAKNPEKQNVVLENTKPSAQNTTQHQKESELKKAPGSLKGKELESFNATSFIAAEQQAREAHETFSAFRQWQADLARLEPQAVRFNALINAEALEQSAEGSKQGVDVHHGGSRTEDSGPSHPVTEARVLAHGADKEILPISNLAGKEKDGVDGSNPTADPYDKLRSSQKFVDVRKANKPHAQRRSNESIQFNSRPIHFDQNPSCNTLLVGNMPSDTEKSELEALFSKQEGYKRLLLRRTQHDSICLVEFQDVTCALKTLNNLNGHCLQGGYLGGMRISFSRRPLETASFKERINSIEPINQPGKLREGYQPVMLSRAAALGAEKVRRTEKLNQQNLHETLQVKSNREIFSMSEISPQK